MKSITYSGKVDGLIVQIEILAWDLLGLEPPRALKTRVRKDYSQVAGSGEKEGPNWLLWGGLALIAAGGGAAVALGGGAADGGSGGTSPISEPPGFPSVP